MYFIFLNCTVWKLFKSDHILVHKLNELIIVSIITLIIFLTNIDIFYAMYLIFLHIYILHYVMIILYTVASNIIHETCF